MSEEGVDFTTGESGSDRPCEEPESLGSSDEQKECSESNIGQPNINEFTRDAAKAIRADDLTDFRRFLESTIATVTESIKALQDSIVTSNVKIRKTYEL
jgi:hypothetical protein